MRICVSKDAVRLTALWFDFCSPIAVFAPLNICFLCLSQLGGGGGACKRTRQRSYAMLGLYVAPMLLL